MKLAGDQKRSRQSGASNRNGSTRVRRRTQLRTAEIRTSHWGEGGGREAKGGKGGGERGGGREGGGRGERDARSGKRGGVWTGSCVPMTCSLGPLQAVAVAALILSTTCSNVTMYMYMHTYHIHTSTYNEHIGCLMQIVLRTFKTDTVYLYTYLERRPV